MKLNYTFLISALLLSNIALSQQTCNCSEEFKWLKQTIETNDAGYQMTIQEKGLDHYQYHNQQIATQAQSIKTLDACTTVLKNWLAFFRKGHLYLNTQSTDSNHLKMPLLSVTDLKESVDNNQNLFIDGIWEHGELTIAIKEDAANKSISGVVLDSKNSYWKKGDLKFITDFDFTQGTFYTGDEKRRATTLEVLNYVSKNIIQFNQHYFKRSYPQYEISDEELTFFNAMTTKTPLFKTLDSTTNYLRIPSFAYSQKKAIKALIDLHKSALLSKNVLIIDLRGNGGGSDESFIPLIELLYTNPYTIQGIEHYATNQNNKNLENRLDISNMTEEDQTWYRNKLNEAQHKTGTFMDVHGRKFSTNSLEQPHKQPKHIAIIVDAFCASSTEQFLLIAKQSLKTKIFGTPTDGALDISNLVEVIAPSNHYRLLYGSSKTMRLPNYKIDDIGIQPDFYMHTYIPNYKWVSHIRSIYNN